MQDTVTENQDFIILSPKVTNATKCCVTKIFDDNSFQIKLMTPEKYDNEEDVELFAVAGSGIVYLASDIKNSGENILTINPPKKKTVIQRREYTRVEIHKNILINHDNHNIRAEIVDISAGGMRLLTNEEMFENISYQTDINLENHLSFSCKFSPIRIVYNEETKKYIISGKFKLIRNIDRVALVQFCLKKRAEMQQETD